MDQLSQPGEAREVVRAALYIAAVALMLAYAAGIRALAVSLWKEVDGDDA